MSTEFFQKLSESHPFITVCSYSGQEFVGIIQNRDDVITTFYDYGSIVMPELKTLFLELADEWWWSSNRMIPIHLFLKDDWTIFRPYIKTFNNKSLEIIHGPVTSMNDLAKKRIKRRSITLVKKMP
mgnify:CR=1 FL=1|jgi:hypothetical protein